MQEQFKTLKYNKGLGNIFATQSVQGTLPKRKIIINSDQNNPIKMKMGLFAQQINGTAFTVKRSQNQKSWLYKLRPSAIQGQYSKYENSKIVPEYITQTHLQYHPNQLRWKPICQVPQGKQRNFVQGIVSIAGAGQPSTKSGLAIYTYSANKSMNKQSFYNSDGDFLIVPQSGDLYVTTQLGKLKVSPRQILVIPRGIKYSIQITQPIKGWIAQTFGDHLHLPQLGPIGANGLANPVDFQIPVASYEDKKQQWTIINKYIGKMFSCKTNFCPYDVVSWKGNYYPYKYDLKHFNTMGSISYDHPDPSIFTVLTSKSHIQGTASLDFVVFPPRWLVAENTFKPPYYHRNCMSQYMGNILGLYDAKGKGFSPGCSSLHSCMTPHGPDSQSYQMFMKSQQKPYKIHEQCYSFMFESGFLLKTTKHAFSKQAGCQIDNQYYKDWLRLSELKFQLQNQQ